MKIARILFLFSAMVAIGMMLVHLRAEMRQTGYLIGKLQARQGELTRNCLQLESQVERLGSMTRLQGEVTRLDLPLQPPGQPDETAGPRGTSPARSNAPRFARLGN